MNKNLSTKYNRPRQDYWKYPEEGYPKRIFWKVAAGPPGFKLDVLQDSDIVFGEYEERYILAL